MKLKIVLIALIVVLSSTSKSISAKYNGFGTKYKTIESAHFRLNYKDNAHDVAIRIGDILEGLYDTYRNTYNITLPEKTEVLVSDDDFGGGWALAMLDMIHIWANDFDYNLRGTPDNLENVVAHEYAHIVSITSAFKFPKLIPYMQFGMATHPNNVVWKSSSNGDSSAIGLRLDAFYIFPSEILPPWFFEGIAQFESSRNNGDSWDTHRDMILRTLVLSDKMLSWDHMSVFTGQEDDFEKTYNQGFALLRYISEVYGYGKVVSILQESGKFFRINFDRAIKESIGISGRQLYSDWKNSLKVHYKKQLDSIGKQVYGKKINKDGFENFWPKFGPKDKKIYFISNGKKDYAYSFKDLYYYDLSDTVKDENRIKKISSSIKKFYSINDSTGLIVYSDAHSKKSILPPKEGGLRVRDIFIDSIPDPNRKTKPFAKKTKRQVTEKESAFHATLSPTGNKIAFTKHVKDKFYLCIADSSGDNIKTVYPPKNDSLYIRTIYSIDWSVDGHHIAISYMDKDDRKIGIYDTLTKTFSVVCNTKGDERDPRFSPNGNSIYFSSDRTGIFNIYRYNFNTETLQLLTNVSGGAFAPDVSTDETKLVYANYDTAGYSIYLIDNLKSLKDTVIKKELAIKTRENISIPQITTDFTPERPYNKMPRQAIIVPTLFFEQSLSENDNPYKGITTAKVGVVASMNDPLDWDDHGTSVGGYFLIEPGKLHKLFSAIWKPEDGFRALNREISYDLGLFGRTSILPVDVSLSYYQRGIASTDYFVHDFYGDPVKEKIRYNLNPHMAELSVTHNPTGNIGLNVFGTLEKYQVFVAIGNSWFPYSPAKGKRIGAFATFRNRAINSKMHISPKGLYAKLKYEFWDRKLQNEDKQFSFENGIIKEVYDKYQYNQLSASLRYGHSSPWYKKHDIFIQLEATGLKLTQKSKDDLEKVIAESETIRNTDIPSFFQPGVQLPGYAYYFRDTSEILISGKTASGEDTVYHEELPGDTILLSGNSLITGNLSYRFPLSPNSIDKKIGFIYLNRIYGILNVGGGIAKNHFNDIFTPFKNNGFKDAIREFRDNSLLYYGAEIRIEAQSFNSYPLAIIARWDYGIDKPNPIGGHKFSLNFGFNFDDWEIILEPDGARVKGL